MRIKIFAIVTMTFLLTMSCATTPPIAEMRTDIQGFQLPLMPSPGKAVVYIVRPSNMGFIIGFKVYVDKKETQYYVGQTLGGQYIYFEVNPGDHIIISQAENDAEYELNANVGKVYFLQQIPTMGILFARNDLVASQDTEGKYRVKHLKIGSLK